MNQKLALVLLASSTLLSACVAPEPVYIPIYVTSPEAAPRPAPVYSYPMLPPLPQPTPSVDDLGAPDPALPAPLEAPLPDPVPQARDDPPPRPSPPPAPRVAAPESAVPLQGFRPMRSQTRPAL